MAVTHLGNDLENPAEGSSWLKNGKGAAQILPFAAHQRIRIMCAICRSESVRAATLLYRSNIQSVGVRLRSRGAPRGFPTTAASTGRLQRRRIEAQ